MSSRSTILNHFPSCGPTQTQGSLWGAGRVHFLSNGSQSGPMPASAATGSSSHFMLLLQSLRTRSCLLSSQRRRGVAREAAKPSVAVLALVRDVDAAVEQREPLGVVSASPGASLIDATCTSAAVAPLCRAQKNWQIASVLQPLARFSRLGVFWRCAAQPRLQIGDQYLRYTSDSPLPLWTPCGRVACSSFVCTAYNCVVGSPEKRHP